MLIVLSVATAQDSVASSDGSFLDIRTGNVSIPLNSIKKPSSDLVDSSGQMIDPFEAVKRAKNGEDLSRYNPLENKIWQNKKYSIYENSQSQYPDSESGVEFLSVEADGNPYTAFYRVKDINQKEGYFRLSLSLISQSTSLRSALLRKLGYDVVTPKAYKKLRVHFKTLEQKTEFIDNLEFKDMNLESRGWLAENKKDSLSIVLYDALIETQRNESQDWHWGFIPNPNAVSFEERSRNLAWIEYFSKFRAYRALIVPFTLAFIPESLNRYSPQSASIINEYVILYHPLASGFASTTKEDIQWLLKRMSSWTEQDYREVFSLVNYPSSIKDLTYRKFILRVKNLFEVFQIPVPAHFPKVDLNFNSPDGLVKQGRVMKEKVPGYPQRFSHGDRESPFKDEDWWKYTGIRARTALISTALSQLNEKLQFLTLDKAQEKFGQSVIKQIQEHFQKNPGLPLDKGIQSWGGPVGGFNLQAARHVSTGTYYGSTAAVQLVDMVSASVSLGYLNNFEKFPNLVLTQQGLGIQRQFPAVQVGANSSLRRSYIHVKPLFSMQEASDAKWKDLFVPSLMSGFAKTIDNPDLKKFREFIKNLKEGEVFTITDSIDVGLQAQVASPLDFLLGIEPLNFMNAVSGGVDASRVVLRQTSLVRTQQGLQIFVRNQTAKARGVQFDVDYFVKIMSLRAENSQSELKTDAFILDYSPDYLDENLNIEEQTIKEEQELKLRKSVSSLLRSNSTEHLYSSFPYQKMEIEHLFKTRETKAKLFLSQMIDLNEDHSMKLRYPRSEEHPELDPRDEEVHLFRSRRGQLKGMDLLGFSISLIESWLNKKSNKINWNLAQPNDPNPANIPFGRAYWRQITTERDLNGDVKDVSIIQHSWGGWKLTRKKFFELIDQIVAELGLPSDAKYKLIDKDSFQNVKGVDFYKVTANLSLRYSALDKVKELVLQSELRGKPGEKARFLSRLFQKLSEKINGTKASRADHVVLSDIQKILGNGDLNQGKWKYQQMCQDHHQKTNPNAGPGGYTGAWVNGSYFDCLTPWMDRLLNLSVKYPKDDRQAQVRWMTEVLYTLEEQVPMPFLLKYLGKENVVYFVTVNGFRSGDEDGDLTYISNTWGNPPDDFDEAGGIFQLYSRKTGVLPTEIDRTQGAFR